MNLSWLGCDKQTEFLFRVAKAAMVAILTRELHTFSKYVADAFTNRGFAYYNKKDYDRAIADFDAALEIQPESAHALYGRGLAKKSTGDSAGGEADIEAARAIQADIAEAFVK